MTPEQRARVEERGEQWNPFYHKVYMRNTDGSYTGLVGVFLTTPDGATAMQAEAAAKDIQAMAAMRKWKIDVSEDGTGYWIARLGVFDSADEPTPADAILSVAAQLDKVKK